LVTFPCRELTGWIRHDSKARNQYLGIQTAATDTKPRTGWSQRQQQTSATALNPTAMRARIWPLLLPDAVCMARRITESGNALTLDLAGLTT